jgi:hypothetical protein
MKSVRPKGWNRISCGRGSKGERFYAWAWIATASPRHHLLIRRNLADPTDLAYFYTYTPAGRPAPLLTLVTVAGMRWPVEEDFQVGKDHFGLDHSQVRLYKALKRHLVLTIAALAICAVNAAAMRHATSPPPAPTSPNDVPPADPGLIAFTVAEIKPAQPAHPNVAQRHSPPPMDLVAATPSSPSQLVPPPHPTPTPQRTNMIKLQMAAAVLASRTRSLH